jgi:hypothetical protein
MMNQELPTRIHEIQYIVKALTKLRRNMSSWVTDIFFSKISNPETKQLYKVIAVLTAFISTHILQTYTTHTIHYIQKTHTHIMHTHTSKYTYSVYICEFNHKENQ